MSDPKTTITETPVAEAPAAEVPSVPESAPAESVAEETPKALGTESLIVQVEVDASRAIAAIKEAAAELESKGAGLEARIHQEIDTLWANIRANVSSVVPTTVHNFIETEKEALKARISSLLREV